MFIQGGMIYCPSFAPLGQNDVETVRVSHDRRDFGRRSGDESVVRSGDNGNIAIIVWYGCAMQGGAIGPWLQMRSRNSEGGMGVSRD